MATLNNHGDIEQGIIVNPADRSSDEYLAESGRSSDEETVSSKECSVEEEVCDAVVVESGKVSVHLSKIERDCRICQDGSNLESGFPIELGCSCKGDLAAAHKHCAEA
ncbi:hypothetical protein KSS87_014369 [Heliosperma pusillum]|nr:hypothetical protein KSS87_014369 [Heliosperma pusillum]